MSIHQTDTLTILKVNPLINHKYLKMEKGTNLLIRLRTEHARSNKTLKRLNLVSSENFDFSNKPCSIKHLLEQSQNTIDLRKSPPPEVCTKYGCDYSEDLVLFPKFSFDNSSNFINEVADIILYTTISYLQTATIEDFIETAELHEDCGIASQNHQTITSTQQIYE